MPAMMGVWEGEGASTFPADAAARLGCENGAVSTTAPETKVDLDGEVGAIPTNRHVGGKGFEEEAAA